MDSHKEVLSIQVGQNESSKYWLGILNELKNRGILTKSKKTIDKYLSLVKEMNLDCIIEVDNKYKVSVK